MKRMEKVLLIPEDKYSRMLEKINMNETRNTTSSEMENKNDENDIENKCYLNKSFSEEHLTQKEEELENPIELVKSQNVTEKNENINEIQNPVNSNYDISKNALYSCNDKSKNECMDIVCDDKESDLFVYKNDLRKQQVIVKKSKLKWLKF